MNAEKEMNNSKSNSTSTETYYHKVDEVMAIGFANGLWYTLMGNNRLSDGFEKKEDAIKDAERKDWIRIMSVIQIMINQKDK